MPLNPRYMCDRVFEMVKEITARIKMLKMELKSRGRETVPLIFCTLLFLGKREQAVNQYFVYILWLVTDNNPS